MAAPTDRAGDRRYATPFAQAIAPIVVVAAGVGLLGSLKTWFRSAETDVVHGTTSHFVDQRTSAGAWSSGRVGVLVPMLLIALAIYLGWLWFGPARAPHRHERAVLLRAGWIAVAVGVACAAGLVASWVVAPSHLLVHNGASAIPVSWSVRVDQARTFGITATISRDVQTGFVLAAVAAGLAVAVGVAMVVLCVWPAHHRAGGAADTA